MRTGAKAVPGFQTLPLREMSSGSPVQMVSPQFSYYHEVRCPSGIYRLEFFGPRMDESGYEVQKEQFDGHKSADQKMV